MEIILALLGGGAVGAIGAAFISSRAMRKVSNGAASESYARAAGLVAEQNTALTVQINKLLAELASIKCSYDVLAGKHELLVVELRIRDANIARLTSEIEKFRLALGKKLQGDET